MQQLNKVKSLALFSISGVVFCLRVILGEDNLTVTYFETFDQPFKNPMQTLKLVLQKHEWLRKASFIAPEVKVNRLFSSAMVLFQNKLECLWLSSFSRVAQHLWVSTEADWYGVLIEQVTALN